MLATRHSRDTSISRHLAIQCKQAGEPMTRRPVCFYRTRFRVSTAAMIAGAVVGFSDQSTADCRAGSREELGSCSTGSQRWEPLGQPDRRTARYKAYLPLGRGTASRSDHSSSPNGLASHIRTCHRHRGRGRGTRRAIRRCRADHRGTRCKSRPNGSPARDDRLVRGECG